MSDRIPGSSYDNPIWYKDYRIYVGPGYTPHDAFEYVHKDYDGPEDSRAGYAASEAEAKELIDDWIESHPDV